MILWRIEALLERERESRRRLFHIYDDIISFDNLLVSWQEFLRGKRKRKDVAEFSVNFLDNILELRHDLKNKTYKHGSYQAFKINDPKPRDIHKATVRDRLVHHALYRVLYPHFDRKFIFDSYSCRNEKGTHKAINRFRDFSRIVSKNGTKTCWILKCDIRKFFASIDHKILKNILRKYVGDEDALGLLSEIIDSFHSKGRIGVGLPLGNLTSQLLVNIYMDEFDQFAKRELNARCYIRYADDFVVLSEDRNYLEKMLPRISEFLKKELALELHPNKVFLKTLASGVDFLGWVNFSDHRVLRTSTRKRMMKKIKKNKKTETLHSYFGMLGHGNTWKIVYKIRRLVNNI